MDSIRGSSRPFVGSCSLLPDRARGRQGPVRPPGRRAARPSRFRIKRKPEAERISNLTSYRTSRTFTATMKAKTTRSRSEEHTSELQSRSDLVCRLLLEKKKKHNQCISHLQTLTSNL